MRAKSQVTREDGSTQFRHQLINGRNLVELGRKFCVPGCGGRVSSEYRRAATEYLGRQQKVNQEEGITFSALCRHGEWIVAGIPVAERGP